MTFWKVENGCWEHLDEKKRKIKKPYFTLKDGVFVYEEGYDPNGNLLDSAFVVVKTK